MIGKPGKPRWVRAGVLVVAVPLVLVVALLLFAWPAGRSGPRDLPLGIVGAGESGQHAASALQRAEPGAFDLSLYADRRTAETAVEHREVYGAVLVEPASITLLSTSAASPAVARQLATLERTLGHELGIPARGVHVIDVVPLGPDDPQGLVIAATVLPLIICSIVIALAVTTVLRVPPGWRRVVALTIGSAAAAAGAYVITQGFLGALPHDHLETAAALGLILLATAATVAGLIALLGPAGLATGAALMVLVGNPFSGATSAPELLPSAVGRLGQWLPPGAGMNLLRSTAYFDGNGSAPHLAVLGAWAVAGLAVVSLRRPVRVPVPVPVPVRGAVAHHHAG